MSLTVSVQEIVDTDPDPLLSIHPTWSRVLLGDVAEVTNGYAFKSALFNSSGEGLPLIRIRNVVDGETTTFTTEDFEPRYLVRRDDLLIGMDGDFNSARWSGVDALLNQRVCKVDLISDEYHPRLLEYALPGYLSAINRHTSSVTVKHLSSRSVKAIPLPFPPLDEQRRIVDKIEELFSDLDAGVQALETARRQLDRYRQSVLKAAVEGDLTRDWREQHAADTDPAEALLERILTERRARWEAGYVKKYETKGKKPPKGWQSRYDEPAAPNVDDLPELPKEWAWASVEQITSALRTCAYGVLKPGPHIDSGIPLVRVGDINDGRIEREGMKRIAPEIAADYERTRLEGGEVLISLVGSIGRTAVVPDELAGANTARAVGVMVVSVPIHAPWVEIWFRSPANQNRMILAANEVARKTLNLGDVRKAAVALPPLAEQEAIVEAVEERLSVVDAVAAEVDRQLARAARLRKSILQHAFEGRLVSRETDDSRSVKAAGENGGIDSVGEPGSSRSAMAVQTQLDL